MPWVQLGLFCFAHCGHVGSLSIESVARRSAFLGDGRGRGEEVSRIRKVVYVRVTEGEGLDGVMVQIRMDEGGSDQHRSQTLDYGRNAKISRDGIFVKYPHLSNISAKSVHGPGKISP